MSATRKPPDTTNAPIGQVGAVSYAGVLPWSDLSWIDQTEHVPELIWPNSVKTYHQMRSDSQCNGLYLGCTMPIRRYRWLVAPNGARDEVVAKFAEDVNLPIQGDESKNKPRTHDKFNWGDFLRQALLGCIYGHYFFEIVGDASRGDGMWHLAGIAPRPPSTIMQINVDDQGGLVWIKQAVGNQAPTLPANRIIPMVWDREGGNWFGRSMFRCVYKNWLIKDRLIRVDAMKHDRNGLGVPWIEAPAGASKSQIEYLNSLAQAFRAGDMSGAATPAGAKLQLVGTTGSIPDTVGSIQYHDESMARAFLMMFIQLGQTRSGSRALGDSFIDYFSLTQQTIAMWIEDTMAYFLIEDWVNWNYGEEENIPLIVHDRDPDPELALADLSLMVQNNIIHVDDELEAFIRDRYMLPQFDPNAKSTPEENKPNPPSPMIVQNVTPKPGNEDQQTGESESQPPDEQASYRHGYETRDYGGGRRKAQVVAVDSLLLLPDRALRRQPYTQEVRASVNFRQMDDQINTAQTTLVNKMKQDQLAQIADLEKQIAEANSALDTLAAIETDPIHADAIQSAMVDMMNVGSKSAVEEAVSQGKSVALPDLTALVGSLSDRAKAIDMILAKALSQAAANKAVQVTGPTVDPSEVARKVGEYLSELSDSYLESQMNGALQQAMNTGRAAVMSDADPSGIYSSELLDTNTCDECTAIDGTQYDNMDDAMVDYPTGGYVDCAGGPNCRGTLVATYGEAPEG